MARMTVDYNEVEALNQSMSAFGEGALREINEILHSTGGKVIQDKIRHLLHASGRKWKKKKAAAKSTMPFQQINDEMLAVTIKSKTAYNYLYFPDDGTNTKHHIGNQNFMERGAEQSKNKIIDLCIGKLTENF